MRYTLYSFLLLLTLVSCSTRKAALRNINPYQYTTTKKVVAGNGAVASAHPLASKVG